VKEAPPFKIAFVTLGCAKNLVDSEKAMGGLVGAGFALTDEPAEADVVVVNTCGFIESAREESIDEILKLAELKKNGGPRTLVVGGCLAVRYREELESELPEVDRFLGLLVPGEVGALVAELAAAEGRLPASCRLPAEAGPDPAARIVTTLPHFAWLKIAEGCSNPCTFCAIPLMRGRLNSFAPDALISEAQSLAAGGVRELIVVAQDTTHYGVDLTDLPRDGRPTLADLVRRLGEEVDVAWIRLMYAYPAHVTADLIEALATTQRVVPYLDIPIQHASDRMLAAMRRRTTQSQQRELLRGIRARIPGIALRTSIIVGFPGETEEDVVELMAFLEEIRFERLGVFPFSPEQNTPAWELQGRVPPPEIEQRIAEVVGLQQRIAAEHNEALVGDRVEVLVEEVLENLDPFRYLGRTPWDAPEVDQGIYLEPAPISDGYPRRLQDLKPGDLVQAEIVGSTDYDLEGVLLPEPPR